ncbi:TonB-dependent receptor [Parabacteroides sp.]
MKNILYRDSFILLKPHFKHIIRIMKLVFVSLSIFISGIFATEVSSQTARVSIIADNISTGDLIQEIEKQTDYLFVYNKNEVNLNRTLAIQATDKTVAEVLNKVFTHTDIIYAMEGSNIMLMRKKQEETEPALPQKEKIINGTITDENNEPIIGANVSVKGTTIGTITDIDGKFTLNVTENSSLQISYIGYLTQEVSIGNKSSFTIQLHEDTQKIEEVVVVGYGVQKKQTVTASASTVKVKSLESLPSTNLSSSLGGRVSGLLVQQSSGEAGYENPKIIIRGSSSPTSSDPLIVVDGIVGRSMSQLDPSEIESMTVLKDASAVAPYGARGANGVILITTKRGNTGKTSVNYSFKGGFGVPTRMPEIASSYDHARFMNEAWRNKEMSMGNDPGMYGVYSEEELQKFRDGSDLYGYPNTNWTKEVLLPRAWQQQHSLTASGGNSNVKYFVGFGYVNQDALYGDTRTNTPSADFKRYNIRANIDANIIDKWLTLSADMAYRQEDRNTIAESTSFIFSNMYRNPQTDPGRFPDGKLGKVSLGYNPIGLVTDGGYKQDRKSIINTRFVLDLKVPGIEGLNVKGIFAYDKDFDKTKTWTSPVNFYIWNKLLGEYDGSSPNKDGADLKEAFEQNQSYTFEAQASYNKTIAKDHQLGALFVFTTSQGKGDDFWAARYKYQISSIHQLFAGPDKDKDNSGKAEEEAKVGSVFRLTYNYKEKYMLEANGRIDGSEKFPKSKRYGFFPSVSAAWRISSEPFMEPLQNIINNLKIRTSWGKAGTDNIGRFRYMSAYGTGADPDVNDNAVFGSQSPEIAIGYTENRFPNPNITWETSEMFNVGINASFFQSKLMLEADFFYKITRDILRERTDMPGILGYKLPAANVGTVDNRGVDMNITHRNSIGEFNYSVTGNLTWARNKVIDLLEPAGQKNNPNLRITGRPMNQQFGYEALGLFQSDEEADNSPQPQFGKAKAGDIKYKDQNGDGIIDAEDRVPIGRTKFPELVFGLSLSGDYKGFDVQLFFQGAGLTTYGYSGFLAHPYSEGKGSTLFEHHINNSWTPENRNAEFPRLYYGGNPNNNYTSSFWQRDGSYLRLKNIEVGYDFKKYLLKRISLIQGLRVFVSAQNLFTVSAIKYMDPELRTDNETDASMDGSAYPQMKNYTLGVNITF